jgi:uncharacterized protein involved in exopolysaccharide biosynthesis
MATAIETPRDQFDRLLAVVRRSFRFAWVAALIAALGTAASVAFALAKARNYESRTVILHHEVISAELLQGRSGAGAGRNIDLRFREMLFASPLLQKAIDEFHLFPKIRADTGIAGALEEMRLRLKFASRGGTFTISFLGDSPVQAQGVTARIADMLIEWEQDIKLESVNSTREFLDKERARAEADLRQKEAELAAFLSEHPEFAQESADVVSGAAGASIRFAKKSTPTTGSGRVKALERQRDRLLARLENRPAPEAPSPEPRTREQRRIAQRVELARNECANAQSALDETKLRFTDRHPDVKAAEQRLELALRRLDQAQAELAAAMGAPAPLEDQPPTAASRADIEAQVRALARDIAEAKREAASEREASAAAEPTETENWVVKLETQWAQLFRAVQEMRERYDAIDSKAFTAEIVAASEAAGGSKLTIVDPAYLPTQPAGASRSILVLAGMVVFSGLGAAVALGLAVIDDRIISPYDIDKLAVADFLVAIPRARKRGRGA